MPLSIVFFHVPPTAAAVFHILLGVTLGQLERQSALRRLWDDAERLYNVYSNNLAVGADLSRFRLHVHCDHISQQRNVKAQLSINVFGKRLRMSLLSLSKLGRNRKAAVLQVLDFRIVHTALSAHTILS